MVRIKQVPIKQARSSRSTPALLTLSQPAPASPDSPPSSSPAQMRPPSPSRYSTSDDDEEDGFSYGDRLEERRFCRSTTDDSEMDSELDSISIPQKRRGVLQRAAMRKKRRPETVSHGIIRKRRYRSGAKALQEVRHYRKTTTLLIPKKPFQRLVKQISNELIRHSPIIGFRFNRECLLALQEAAESMLTKMFGDVNELALHAKRKTIMPRDICLIRKLQGF